jgi:pyruvate dehydrogenase E2 component (dihydrolipoamide acetyltransferase)
METSNEVVSEQVASVGGHKVTPAVRALAKKLKVDLGQVAPSGDDGVITARDVKAAAKSGSAPLGSSTPAPTASAAPLSQPPAPATEARGEWTPVRGTRRTMARAMAEAHAQVVPTTITEDADVGLWEGKQDITVRMIRSLVAAARREPGLNAWFNADGPERLVHPRMHVGIAVDTPDGLFVSTLRDADLKTPAQLRGDINQLRDNVQNRSIPPEDLTGYTFILSNVGIYAGKYTSPVITPPCVGILATGKMRSQVVASHGGMAVHPIMPLSLTFDHRAVTGGEAARFLAALIEDLCLPG